MTHVTIEYLAGNTDDLFRRKKDSFDPVAGKLARIHGGLCSVTAKADGGLVVINVWTSAEGSIAFDHLPQIRRSRRLSGLPLPDLVERYGEACFRLYDHQPKERRASPRSGRVTGRVSEDKELR